MQCQVCGKEDDLTVTYDTAGHASPEACSKCAEVMHKIRHETPDISFDDLIRRARECRGL